VGASGPGSFRAIFGIRPEYNPNRRAVNASQNGVVCSGVTRSAPPRSHSRPMVNLMKMRVLERCLIAGLAVLLTACGDGGSGPGGGLDAPTNLSATGSTDATSVVVSWDSVSHATGYNLYWRSTPGVTPANGAKIPVTSPHNLGNGRLAYFDTGRTAGSIYYVVTAVGAQGESDPSGETFVTLADGLGVAINRPQGGTLVADSVFFEVYVQSVFEIATVVVSVENRQASLTFSNIMPGPGAGWRGYLVFSGLSAGSKRAVVTVRDIKGNQAERSVALRFGVTPVIAIQSPLQYTVVRSTLHVTATCQEGSQPCRTTEVRLASGGQSPVVLFSTGSGSIDRDVDVSTAAGQPALLQITGLGQSGITADARRTIYVEPSAALHELATVPGRVLDVLSGRVLWLDSTATVRAVRIRSVAAGTDVTALTESGGGFLGGALTSTGAVFAFTAPGQNGRVHAFRNGSLTTVGGHGSASLQVTGDFAVWNEGETLKRYDASTGALTTVAANAGNTSNSVGPNGDVVYWTNGYQIVRVRGGTATPITSGPSVSVVPVTDGTNVVFRQAPPGFQGPWQTILFDGSNFIPLAASSPNDPSRELCYAVNAGWTGYCKLGSAQETQTWTRSPAGEERQASFFASGSLFEALSPAGQVIFVASSAQAAPRRFLAVPPYTGNPSDIGGGSMGTPVFRGAAAYLLLGRSAFTIAP